MLKKRPRQGLNFAQKERLSEIIGVRLRYVVLNNYV